ncbi:MAG: outer membrane protein assembly factor BamB [Betaproteobacteria bacterium RBG_16_64_9]|nr:MAG: outer membrane protein assembly factor BamB [Betaproteobacteria bacterium RBG_16_64_9]OGA79812.1 MAG: outer membrane protein assembly factor BamB [Betaproteobacteria bacterium RIFCSPLOWO2_12_FULL_66_14]
MVGGLKAICAATAVALLAGCAYMNPFTWFEDNRPKMAPLPELTSSLAVRTLWQASVGGAGEAAFSPAVVQNSVFAAARDGTVVRLDASNGRALWRANAGQPLSAGVGASAALVAVGTPEGEVIALDAADGKVRWRARVSSEVLAAPLVTDDAVIARCSDGRVFSLDAADGRRRWVYQRAIPTLTVRSTAGLAIRGQTAYAGFPGGRLAAIALNNGGVRWEGTVALPRGSTELERVADVVGVPWVAEREVCAVAYQGRVACLDGNTGQPLWARAMSSISGLGVDARYVFVSDDRDAVHALDRSNGTSVWKQDGLSRRKLTAPLALGREIAVADAEGYVHFLSRENGQLIGRVATDGSAVAGPMKPFPGGLLVQTRNGNVYALGTQ